jgi:hypothetical protein
MFIQDGRKYILESITCETAQKIGKSGKLAKFKENSGMSKTFQQLYPQNPWTCFLLRIGSQDCSQKPESSLRVAPHER